MQLRMVMNDMAALHATLASNATTNRVDAPGAPRTSSSRIGTQATTLSVAATPSSEQTRVAYIEPATLKVGPAPAGTVLSPAPQALPEDP